MASKAKRYQFFIILLILLCSTAINGAARTVYSTNEVDIFPQGEISSDDSWYLDNKITFTQSNADYTTSMVADNRITFEHERPANLQSVEVWSQSSPTDSQYVTGAPDMSYSYTNGPVIEVTDFDIGTVDEYEIIAVNVVVAFHIPGPLLQDQVRFTMNNAGDYNELVTYVNTQSAIDYMNGSKWSKNISTYSAWTWSELENLVVTLDYVSLGNTDDTQLDIDAVGLSVLVEYPWYGNEWASVESTSQGFDMPILNVDFNNGTFDGMQKSSCGLSPLEQGVEGTWLSNTLTTQPGQKFGRIHFATTGSDGYIIEASISADGTEFTDFVAYQTNDLLNAEAVILKVKSTNSCISQIRLDYNDPSLIIDGRVFGSLEGLATDYSRWKVFVNGQEATYQLIDQLTTFTTQLSIGQFLNHGVQDLTVKIQAWFNWDSTGVASATLLEINSISVTGGFAVSWDEDPVCENIGAQYFAEDGSGILIPFLDKCQDDRTSSENLSVSFEISDESLVVASMVQDDIKLIVQPEQSGTATVTIRAADDSNNIWEETFVVYVEEVDDQPVLAEFPSVVVVESSVTTAIPFSYFDIDSTSVIVTTDKSWAVIDSTSATIVVTPPNTTASTPIIVTACDQTSCVNQTLVLEVMSLAELFIEEIIIDAEDISQGDVVPVRIYVRNGGNSEAALISVRCQSENNLVGIRSIPLLTSGELAVVTCDWQQSKSGSQTMSVELDRVNQIMESDESNNIEQIIIEVAQSAADTSGDETVISTTALWIATLIIVTLIFVLFVAFAPGKIKKL